MRKNTFAAIIVAGDLVAHISRVGHDQRRRGQPTQHRDEVASLARLAAFAQTPTKGKTQRQVDNRRVPDHRRRALFAEGSQALLQFLGARTRLPCAIAAQGNEVPHLPPVAEDRFHTTANCRGQRPQHGHGQLGHGLLESRKRRPGPFSFGTTDHVEPLGRLELLGEAVAATVGGQQEDVEQRMQIPTRRFPSLRGISHLLENGRCEKLPHRADQRLGPPSLACPLPCVGHLPFLREGVWCSRNPIIAGTAFSCITTFSAYNLPRNNRELNRYLAITSIQCRRQPATALCATGSAGAVECATGFAGAVSAR